jgi:hypothetical protein
MRVVTAGMEVARAGRAAAYVALLLLFATCAWSQGDTIVGRITVRPDRGYVLSDDTDSVGIQVDVLDTQGRPVPDGTEVVLTASAGRLEDTNLTTLAGVARTRFFSGGSGEAEVHLMALAGGKQAERQEIIFIQASPTDTSEGSRCLRVDADDYLAFFDDGQMVEALGNARFSFRRISITAERLQVRIMPPYNLNAKNATVSNGKQTIKTRWLYMEFRPAGASGVALVEDPNPHTVEFINEDFGEGTWFYPEDKWREWETSEAKVVVKASDILVVPDDKIILNRPRIYYEGVQLPFPMSAQVIPLSGGGTSESAVPQVLGLSYPGGIFVDYPWYFSTGERFTGAVRIRHGSPVGNYSTRKGWYADIEMEYLSRGKDGGRVVMDGLGQKDWGARWSHNATYGGASRGTYSVAWPQHRYVSAYGNVTTVRPNATNMVNASWFSGTGLPEDWYVDSSWRFKSVRLAGLGLGYGANVGVKQDAWGTGDAYGRAGCTASLAPVKPWKVVGSLTIAPRVSGAIEQRTNGETEWSSVMGVEANLRFSRMGSFRVAYDAQTRDGARYQNGTRHYLRAGLSYFTSGEKGLSIMISGTRDLDNARTSAYGWMNWAFASQWSLQLTGMLNRSAAYGYSDYTYGIARRIGQAEATVLYSTQRKRWEFGFSRATGMW